jgi:hypothetical protein
MEALVSGLRDLLARVLRALTRGRAGHRGEASGPAAPVIDIVTGERVA